MVKLRLRLSLSSLWGADRVQKSKLLPPSMIELRALLADTLLSRRHTCIRAWNGRLGWTATCENSPRFVCNEDLIPFGLVSVVSFTEVIDSLCAVVFSFP